MTKTWQAKRAANHFGIGVIYHSHKRRTLPAQPCSRIGSRKFTARIDLIRLFLSGASEGSHRLFFSGPTIPNSGLFPMSLGFDGRAMFALIVDACGELFIVRHRSQSGHLVTVRLVRSVSGTSAGSSTVFPLHQERRVASCCARPGSTSILGGPYRPWCVPFLPKERALERAVVRIQLLYLSGSSSGSDSACLQARQRTA